VAETDGSPRVARDDGGAPLGLILAFVGACAIEKAFAIVFTGFNDDEAYTVVISRVLALSYFDHPPLHQWILHGFAALFGEGKIARAPFWFINIATSGALFGLTRRLFGRDAALWAIFAFNATPYFLLLPDGFIMPDAPLLMFLAFAGWGIAEILYGPPGREGGPWLGVGLALGAAGLSKYSAIFAPVGLLGFFAFSPRHRRWLADPRPYVAAALALVVFSPALIWNAENHWVSFAFQSNRAAAGVSLGVKAWAAVAEGLGAQIALLSPWVAVPVVAGLIRATRRGADSGERFALWLAAPPLVLFALIPLLGQRAIPHWFNSGWLFAFPLAGAWLAERSNAGLRAWSRAAAGLAVVIVALYLPAVIIGPARLLAFAPSGARDPTRFSYDWRVDSKLAPPPDVVVVDNWRVGGRIGVALGPGVAIHAFTSDPRGFAFMPDAAGDLGADALIVLPGPRAPELAELSGYFENVDPPRDIAIGRGDGAERWLTVARAHRLLRPYPLPYGPAKR
jgi:hypothetical protein